MKIAILGCGNLGTSIVEGVLKKKSFSGTNIIVTKRNKRDLKYLSDKGVTVSTDNLDAVKKSDIVILSVKPYQAIDILNQIKGELKSNKLLVSTVTGLSINEIRSRLTSDLSIFRVMPNIAIAVQQSITCISSINATNTQNESIRNLFKDLGEAIFIEEKLLDAATVLGACGTAYALRYIRAAIQGGIEIGFDADMARLIVTQTVKGAAQLLLENNRHPEEEIDKVATPKGCTITGLNEMEHQGFSSSLIKGIRASFEKISEM